MGRGSGVQSRNREASRSSPQGPVAGRIAGSRAPRGNRLRSNAGRLYSTRKVGLKPSGARVELESKSPTLSALTTKSAGPTCFS